MDAEIEIKIEETNDSIKDHQYLKIMLFKSIKTEIGEKKTEETGDTSIETEPLKKKIKYEEEEFNVETSNQSSRNNKGSENVGKVTLYGKGKGQLQKSQPVCKLLQQRGAEPGPSVELVCQQNTSREPAAFQMSGDERSPGSERIWDTSQEDTKDEELQYLQQTRAMELATVEDDLHVEEATPTTLPWTSKQLKTYSRKRVPPLATEVHGKYEQPTPTELPGISENRTIRKRRPRPAPPDMTSAVTSPAVASDVAQQNFSTKRPLDDKTPSGRSSLEQPPGADADADVGSDADDDEKPDEFGLERSLFRSPTLATDSPAILPNNINPKIIDAIKEMDDESDKDIRALLPEEMLSFDWQSDMQGFAGTRNSFTGTPGNFSCDQENF